METVSILEHDPDLGEDLSAEQLDLACQVVRAEVLSYPAGAWEVGPDHFNEAASFGLLLIEGLLAREVTVADYTCAEVLGPGDVVQPWLRIGPDQSVASEVDWDVVQPVEVAVLDREFFTTAAQWPEIPAAIARRAMQRTHWLAFHLAVCGLRRIEERLLLVLWHFADRWGTVTPEGVRLDVRLTHDLLAAVTGSRRPSVSSGLQRLAQEGRIKPLPRSRWLLFGRPPAELRQIHTRSRRLSRDLQADQENTPKAS